MLCLSLHHQLQCAAMDVSVAKREKGTLKLLIAGKKRILLWSVVSKGGGSIS